MNLIHVSVVSPHLQAQPDANQYGGGYYGYGQQGYENYGYAPATQDPNMYYGGYPGYGNYQQGQQQQVGYSWEVLACHRLSL